MNENKTLWQRLKSKITLSLLFYVIMLAVIVITTLVPSLFDFRHANWSKIFANTIISTCIVLLSFTYQAFTTKRTLEQNLNGDFYKSDLDFKNMVKKIQDLNLSSTHELYVKDENEKIKQDYIKAIFKKNKLDLKCLDCDVSIVEELLKEDKITKKQYKLIMQIRNNDFKCDTYDVTDLTCTFNLKSNKNTNKSQQNIIIRNELLSKVLMLIIMAILWGSLAYDELTKGVTPQSYIDLAGRLINLIAGIWAGDNCGRLLVQDETRLNIKFTNFNNKFLQDFNTGIWKPKENHIPASIVEQLIEKSKLSVNKTNTEIVLNNIKTESKESNLEENNVEYEEVEMTEEEYLKIKEKGNNDKKAI